jgi:hypothetical protein
MRGLNEKCTCEWITQFGNRLEAPCPHDARGEKGRDEDLGLHGCRQSISRSSIKAKAF